MNKKFISSILVVALLNLLGCYSFESVTVPEYKQVEEEEGKPNEIYVLTKDYREYHFSDSNFYIENDTLYGKGKSILNNKKKQFDGKIALSEIESIEVEKINWLTSNLLCLGLTPIILFISLVIAMAAGGKWSSRK